MDRAGLTRAMVGGVVLFALGVPAAASAKPPEGSHGGVVSSVAHEPPETNHPHGVDVSAAARGIVPAPPATTVPTSPPVIAPVAPPVVPRPEPRVVDPVIPRVVPPPVAPAAPLPIAPDQAAPAPPLPVAVSPPVTRPSPEVLGKVLERTAPRLHPVEDTALPAPVAAPVPPKPAATDRSSVSSGLPIHLDLSGTFVASNAGLALLFVLLLVAAAQLFNDTVRANHDDLARRFHAVAARIPGVGGLRRGGGVHLPPLVTFVAVAGTIALLADPSVSLSSHTLAQIVGMSLAFGCIVVVYDGLAAALIARSSGLSFHYRMYPIGLGVAIASMLLSRVLHVAPGVVYGLVAGFVFAAPTAGRQVGAAYARTTALMYATVIVAFVLHRHLALNGDVTASFTYTMLDTATAAVCVSGLQSTVVQLLPMQYVNGEQVAAWSRAAWFGLLLVGMTLYLQLVVRPEAGNQSWGSVGFAVLLMVAAGAFWAAYQVKSRRSPAAPDSPPEELVPVG